jgi:hypothetical protein
MGGTISVSAFIDVVEGRQEQKDADTFVVIYANPRTGKTTLGFHLIMEYIKRKREKKGTWKPEATWEELFKKYFTDSAEDMNKKIIANPDESMCFVDEGLDVASHFDQMGREQRELVILLQKTGKKKDFTILITTSIKLLTKSILARAEYLFILVDEPDVVTKTNKAYLLQNWGSPFLREGNPFDIYALMKKFTKHPNLAASKNMLIHNFQVSRCYRGIIEFGAIDRKLYELYDKIVKEPSIMNPRRRSAMFRYEKLSNAFNCLIYNLIYKEKYKLADVHRLTFDRFGDQVMTYQALKRRLMGKDIPGSDDNLPEAGQTESEEDQLSPQDLE